MIGIIDYDLGNMTSVKNALDKLGVENIISRDKNVLKDACGLILPGVGAAGHGMANLEQYDLKDFIKEQIKIGKPFLGICLGMQLLFDFSEEGNVDCLRIIPGTVKKFAGNIKIPQIGWNEVEIATNNSQLTANIDDKSYFYFVNSYYCEPKDNIDTIGITNYNGEFCSIVGNANVFGTQFHPEKSGDAGLMLLKNFSSIC